MNLHRGPDTLAPVDELRFRLLSSRIGDGSCVVSLGGELDLAQAAEIDRELESLYERGERNVIVDLLEVPFLDSHVLGVLLRHSRRLSMNGGVLTLVTDDVRVNRVIEITGLQGRFRIAPTLSGALEDAAARVT